MIASERPFTYADLRAIPDDGMRREVIGGELVVTPAPTPGHQRVLKNLFRLIDDFARESGAGEALFAPVDVLLGRFNVVQPDLIFLSAVRPRVPSDQQAIEGAPELVAEVLSPSSRGSIAYAKWRSTPVQECVNIGSPIPNRENLPFLC